MLHLIFITLKHLAQISIIEFESIFRSHYEDLCAVANRYLEDLEAAEEIVQSVFVKFWEGRSEINIQSSIKGYLITAVKNNCLNQLKHIKIREEYKQFNQRELETSHVLADDEVEATELEEKIRASINQLPEARKKIFVLSRFEGLKYQEIADKLNISVKTVENQMGSAIKQLRTDLAEYLVSILIILGLWN
ncbi:MAG: RNA polymerase sigma-70 factor [Crocinitomicaceae bacterium]|nr:RNA polymerase sigma-70 factor [Crocinitomicaceae bacterium]